MNPLMAASFMSAPGGPGVPGMPGGIPGITDSGSAVAGDIKSKNENGGAIHFAPAWQSQLIWLGVAGLGLAALYIWKK